MSNELDDINASLALITNSLKNIDDSLAKLVLMLEEARNEHDTREES